MNPHGYNVSFFKQSLDFHYLVHFMAYANVFLTGAGRVTITVRSNNFVCHAHFSFSHQLQLEDFIVGVSVETSETPLDPPLVLL